MTRYGRGDKGETDLLGGVRVPKDDERIEAYGTIDELNSFIGLAKTMLREDGEVAEILERIQGHLFKMGSELASLGTRAEGRTPGIAEEDLRFLEEEVERLESLLPPLRLFIYPGGTVEAAILHVARSVARRAERRLTTLMRRYDVRPLNLSYLNRLSTLLFILARYVNHRKGVREDIWRGR